MIISKFCVFPILLGIFLVGCTAQNPGNIPLFGTIWIDEPLEGATYPWNIDPVEILIHGAAPGGVQEFHMQWDHFVDGNLARSSAWATDTSLYSIGSNDYPSGPEETNPGLFSYIHFVEADGPGLYVVRVKAEGMDGSLGEIAETKFTICAEHENAFAGLCLPSVVEQTTPTPPSPTISSADLIAIPSQNANCRLGPSSTYFDIVDTLFSGEEYLPLSKGPDHQWVRFQGTAYEGRCWVFVDSLDLFCNDAMVEISDVSPCVLPIEAYPPFPTLTPTPTLTPEPSETSPECSDGIDNDGDGDIDLADGRCVDANDDREDR